MMPLSAFFNRRSVFLKSIHFFVYDVHGKFATNICMIVLNSERFCSKNKVGLSAAQLVPPPGGEEGK